jgi:hypothetical protein
VAGRSFTVAARRAAVPIVVACAPIGAGCCGAVDNPRTDSARNMAIGSRASGESAEPAPPAQVSIAREQPEAFPMADPRDSDLYRSDLQRRADTVPARTRPGDGSRVRCSYSWCSCSYSVTA